MSQNKWSYLCWRVPRGESEKGSASSWWKWGLYGDSTFSQDCCNSMTYTCTPHNRWNVIIWVCSLFIRHTFHFVTWSNDRGRQGWGWGVTVLVVPLVFQRWSVPGSWTSWSCRVEVLLLDCYIIDLFTSTNAISGGWSGQTACVSTCTVTCLY